MGWSKRREPFTTQQTPQTQQAHHALAAEEIPEMPDSEPELVEDSPVSRPVSAATIGATLHVQGELTGHEDVTIDGSLEGRVELLEHTLTVGPSASIKASIRARCVVIEGQVVGDVTADDKVEVMATGSLVGDVRAARVVLAENARFKGNIDMGASESAPAPKQRAAQVAPPRPPVREERPSPPPAKAAAPAARGGSLSALDWDEPAPTPPTQFASKKDEES